ncbi:MAG: hypothetical protein F6J93_23855 [Oscillatoria sp. SIO1A7]|nr:hypothetical protein [Oscillatoria sp. SIO1A7]
MLFSSWISIPATYIADPEAINAPDRYSTKFWRWTSAARDLHRSKVPESTPYPTPHTVGGPTYYSTGKKS